MASEIRSSLKAPYHSNLDSAEHRPDFRDAFIQFAKDGNLVRLREEIQANRQGGRVLDPKTIETAKEWYQKKNGPLSKEAEDVFKEAAKALPEVFLQGIKPFQYQGCSEELFLVSNETGSPVVLEELRAKKPSGNTVVATASFFALDIAVARGECVDAIVIVDYSTRAQAFWKELEMIILESKDSEEAFQKIEKIINESAKEFFGHKQNIDFNKVAQGFLKSLTQDMAAGHSWLSSNENFQKIKQIFVERRCMFILASWFDIDHMERVRKIMEECSLVPDTVFLSNLMNYASYQKIGERFEKVVALFLGRDNKETHIVSAKKRISVGSQQLHTLFKQCTTIKSYDDKTIRRVLRGQETEKECWEYILELLKFYKEKIKVSRKEDSARHEGAAIRVMGKDYQFLSHFADKVVLDQVPQECREFAQLFLEGWSSFFRN